MAKQNQILAIEKGIRASQHDSITELDRILSKPALTAGISRVYAPKDEGGEALPSESTLVQKEVFAALRAETEQFVRFFDVVAAKEWTNTVAKSDVVLEDGTVIATGVPVTYLLFLEKQLVDIHTLVGRLPVLDPQYTWSWDANAGAYRTDVQETHRTKKVPKAFVKAEATPQHPAQVEVFTEDVIVGFWNTTHLSGAIPADARQLMTNRVEALQRAVKQAREKANDVDVIDTHVGAALLAYVFPEISR